ncbi:MAG TPA: peptidylprolyl isomerase [Candidatus Nanoarchaeia archaeon]|nr:peptidylprolyl isomerase [Candidatus Nanoarchaeia archaeon]
MNIQKNDFIEIEFSSKIKDGELFDSNIKEDLEKLHHGHSHNIKAKPLIFCIGQGMFLKGVEDFLLDKDLGTYNIDLTPEKAFGPRLPQFVQTISAKVFREQKLNPYPGASFNFDGRVGKVLTVSGGRIMVDFNNPLAGKDVSYKVTVLRKVEDINEKIKAFIEFLFRKDLKFEIKEKTLTIYADVQLSRLVQLFEGKFKEIFDLGLKVEEVPQPETIEFKDQNEEPIKLQDKLPEQIEVKEEKEKSNEVKYGSEKRD